MAITLRNNKGAALTYEELDINFHSFFYSASVSNDAKQLTLHYTGSTLQSSGGINIALNTYTGSSEVAGDPGQIQYNLDDINFAGATGLIYDSSKAGLAIGTSSLETGEKFRVNGGLATFDEADIRIQNGAASASLSYGGTTKDLTIRNWFNDNSADIIIETKGSNEVLRAKGDGTITHKGADASLGDFVISGSIIFGKTHEDTYRSKLFTWDSSNPRIESNTGNNLLIGNERGIILEGPQNAHVLVGIQSNTGNDSFSIISAPPTSSQEPTYNKLVAHFGADGKTGIGTTPVSGYTLSVAGSISGSNGLNIAGNTVITGSVTMNSTLNVSGSSTLSGSVTLNTVDNAASANNYNFLVLETDNSVAKQVNAAPIPVGGIIMWSGAIASIPTGWALCNGSNGTPDLRNKFIIGAHSDLSGTAKSNVEGASTFNQTGGDISHNHGGNTTAHTLTSGQIPSHTHTYKDSYYIEINNPGTGASGTLGGADYVGPTKYKGSGDSDNDNKYVYWRSGTTNSTGTGGSHSHPVPTDNHLPPYFALAYIMYTG